MMGWPRLRTAFTIFQRGIRQDSSLKHFENRGGWASGHAPWLLGGATAAMGGYYMYCLETIPYTGRKHSIMFVSRNQEHAMGKIVFQMQLEEARRNKTLLPESHRYVKLVRKVGSRIAQVASLDDPQSGLKEKTGLRHMKNLEWDYIVVKSPIPNAMVVPGGKVVVHTALIDLLSSEDELAAVLAHETAHVLARHHAERMSTVNLIALIQNVFYWLVGFSVPPNLLFVGVFLPYSRIAEHEADSIGLRLMARACHDPRASTSMLSKLGDKEHQMSHGSKAGAISAFFRTHPLTEDRVERVKRQVPEAYQQYLKGCMARQEDMRSSWILL